MGFMQLKVFKKGFFYLTVEWVTSRRAMCFKTYSMPENKSSFN